MTLLSTFEHESLAFHDPLLSAKARRRIVLQCQAEWDRRVADQVGRASRVSHLTVLEGQKTREFVVAQGEQIPYPPELQQALEEARAWARKRVDRPPALAWT